MAFSKSLLVIRPIKLFDMDRLEDEGSKDPSYSFHRKGVFYKAYRPSIYTKPHLCLLMTLLLAALTTDSMASLIHATRGIPQYIPAAALKRGKFLLSLIE